MQDWQGKLEETCQKGCYKSSIQNIFTKCQNCHTETDKPKKNADPKSEHSNENKCMLKRILNRWTRRTDSRDITHSMWMECVQKENSSVNKKILLITGPIQLTQI